MKRTLIITLLLLVAAFSFSQTNANFNNLDVRGTSKFRGLIYPFGVTAKSPLSTSDYVTMVEASTFKLLRVSFQEFADSLQLAMGSYWYLDSPDTIKSLYNVVVDSSLLMKYDGMYIGEYEFNDIDGNNHSWIISNKSAGGHKASIGIGKQDTSAYLLSELYSPDINLQLYVSSMPDFSKLDILPKYVTIDSDSTVIKGDLYFDPIPDEGDKVGRIAHFNQYGKVEWISPAVLGDSIAVSGGGPWTQGTNVVYPSTATDTVKVLGNLKLPVATATTGIIYKSTAPWLHDFSKSGTTGDNIFMGRSVANLTLTGSSTGDQGSYNIMLGDHIANNLTTGYGNIVMGHYTGFSLTTGNNNIAIGNAALQQDGAQIGTIAIGFQALKANTGDYNTGIGYNVMLANTTGNENTALGYAALDAGATPYQMTAIGKGALSTVTYGYGSTAIGVDALGGTDTVVTNVAVGNSSLLKSKRACNTAVGNSTLIDAVYTIDNVALGNGALMNLQADTWYGALAPSGSENVAIGVYVGDSINYSGEGAGTGSGNVLIGQYGMRRGRAISKNVAIGYHVGYNNIVGDSNIYIGAMSGYNATGSNNVFIGDRSGYNETGSDKLYIENSDADSANALIFGNFATDHLTINGTLTTGNSFAELFEDASNVTAVTATYKTIVSLQAGDYNAATLTDSTITIPQAGTYLVNYSSSFTHATNSTLCHISLFVNDVEDTSLEAERKIGTGGDYGSMSGTALVTLPANAVLKLKAKADNNGNLTIQYLNFNVTRIK